MQWISKYFPWCPSENFLQIFHSEFSNLPKIFYESSLTFPCWRIFSWLLSVCIMMHLNALYNLKGGDMTITVPPISRQLLLGGVIGCWELQQHGWVSMWGSLMDYQRLWNCNVCSSVLIYTRRVYQWLQLAGHGSPRAREPEMGEYFMRPIKRQMACPTTDPATAILTHR